MASPLKQKPSGVWYLEHTLNGKRARTSTGTKDREEAKRIARDIELGITPAPAAQLPAAAQARKTGAIYTMADLFDACLHTVWHPKKAKAQRTILSNIRILSRMIGDVQVTAMTKERLLKLKVELEAAEYAPATVKRKMDSVSRALTEAVDLGVLKSRPVMPVLDTADNYKERVVSHEEERLILAAIDSRIERQPARQWLRFKCLFIWLLDTGCRLSEPLQATEGWLMEHKGRPFLSIPEWATKNGKARTVPLAPSSVECLGYLRATAVAGRLFPMKPATAWYMWDTIREDVRVSGKADLDDVVLHTLRHTCLTRLIQNGMALHNVSRWAGHGSVDITMKRYVKITAGDLLDAVESLSIPFKNGYSAIKDTELTL